MIVHARVGELALMHGLRGDLLRGETRQLAFGVEQTARFGQLYAMERTGQNVIRTLRAQVFAHLQSLDAAFFDGTPVGRLMTRVTTDVESLADLFASGAVSLLGDVVKLAAIVLILWWLDPRLALVTFTVMPVLFGLSALFRGRIRQSYRDVRRRIALLRNEILLARRASTATRGIARRIVDGRVDVGRSELFPPEVEARFVDTYETLVRVTEELDVARDLLGGVRDYYQAKIAEQQNEVGKKLTVIASLVLVPSFIVGFYGQNFGVHFRDWYWSIGVSVGLIVATTVVQLALFRWRRWL